MRFKCKICDKKYTRRAYLHEHLQKVHSSDNETDTATSSSSVLIDCPFCGQSIKREDIKLHIDSFHQDCEFEKTSCIGNNVCLFRKYLHSVNKSIEAYCLSASTVASIYKLMKLQLIEKTVFRASIALTANYEIPDLQESDEQAPKSADADSFTLRSKGEIFNRLQSERQIKNRIRKMLKGAASRNEDLLHRGSGWKFVNLGVCDVLIYRVRLM